MLAALSIVNDSSNLSDDRSDLSDRLETARSAIEAKFVGAGQVLSEAVDGVGALILALDDLTGALAPTAIVATVDELEGAAAKLLALPSNHEARRTLVSDLDRHRAAMGEGLSDMRRSLAYMRAFTMNIKITAGGIAQADAEFAVFAQEISTRIEAGRTELDTLQRELDALQQPIATVFRHCGIMAARCAELIPRVPDELNASAKLIGEHHRMIAAAAASSANLARDIRKKVGRTLAALQVGDSTRQRIEHIQTGLGVVERMRGQLTVEAHGRASGLMYALLAAQLDDTAQRFDQEVGQIHASMDGLESDAKALLKLRDLAYGSGDRDNPGLLQALELRLRDAGALVADIETAEREVLATAHATADAAHVVANRLAAIQVMKSDVQYMALNTTLKSCRLGEVGRPLATIAVELRAHAGYLEQTAAKSLATLNALMAAAVLLTGADPTMGEDVAPAHSAAEAANAALSGAARRIGEASARTETDISRLAEHGEAVLSLLSRSSGRFGFQEEIGHALGDVRSDLATLVHDVRPCDSDIHAVLCNGLAELQANYTMDQERSIQSAFMDAWGLGGDATVAMEAMASAPMDDLEDVLF